MKLDILNFGTEETLARYATNKQESAMLMEACAALRDAYARFDAAPVDFDDVAALLRRWIEGQTFAPRTGESGVPPAWSRSRDDTDEGWGDRPAPDDDERILREVPPHW